jgi:arsenate reductase-like glutaredoxin family protein
VEEFLSHHTIPFAFRDVITDPLTPAELRGLMDDPLTGRQRGPFTRLGTRLDPVHGYNVVLGVDLVRLDERLEEEPALLHEVATLWGRPDDHRTRTVHAHLASRGLEVELVDLDRAPLSQEHLWALLEIPRRNIRTPFTRVGETVILGNDVEHLEEALQAAQAAGVSGGGG